MPGLTYLSVQMIIFSLSLLSYVNFWTLHHMMSLQENRTDNLPNTNLAQNASSKNPPSIKTENPSNAPDIQTAVTQPPPRQLGKLSNVLAKK